MRPLRCGAAVVDRCGFCGGIWFDEGGLGQFRAGLEWRDLDAIPSTVPSTAPARRSAVPESCPHCGHGLARGEYAYGSGVRIARCGGCEGVWLPGEQVARFVAHLREAKEKRGETREIAESIAASSRARIGVHEPMRYSSLRHFPLGGFLGALSFLPLRTDAMDGSTPRATVALMLVQLFVFFFVPAEIAASWALVPAALAEGAVGPLLASGLVHGGWGHLLGNGVFLLVFGGSLEAVAGPLRFIALYFAAEIGANLLYVASVGLASTTPCIGASGAISGVLGAFFVLRPDAKVTMLMGGDDMRAPAWIYLGGWIVLQAVSAWFDGLLGGGSVAWSAHFGGFAVGALFGWRLRVAGY